MKEIIEKVKSLIREVQNDGDACYNAGVIDALEILEGKQITDSNT